MTAALQFNATDSMFDSRLFGRIQVPAAAVLTFHSGVPGFPEARLFALLKAAAPRLSWLQSLEEPALAFLMIEWEAIAEPLEGGSGDTFAVVTLPSAEHPGTANLQAPVWIDRGERLGRQVIRTDATPGTAVPIDLEALVRPA